MDVDSQHGFQQKSYLTLALKPISVLSVLFLALMLNVNFALEAISYFMGAGHFPMGFLLKLGVTTLVVLIAGLFLVMKCHQALSQLLLTLVNLFFVAFIVFLPTPLRKVYQFDAYSFDPAFNHKLKTSLGHGDSILFYGLSDVGVLFICMSLILLVWVCIRFK